MKQSAALLALGCLIGQVSFAQTPQPERIRGRAFGAELLMEIQPFGDRQLARDALAAALEEALTIESLTRLEGDPELRLGEKQPQTGLRGLNMAAGGSPFQPDPRLLAALERALGFCAWSRQAYGPLGGILNGLWGIRQSVADFPSTRVLAEQVPLANCERLRLDHDAGTAMLSARSNVDLWGFERGLAVDRAVVVLEQSGAKEGWVQLGHVTRAFGDGPTGQGWPMAIDATGQKLLPVDNFFLHNQAVSLAALWQDTIEIAGERFGPYLNHRTGQPARETLAVLVVTELALDAQALAAALFVLDNREGEFHLGSLRPRPAVKWYLGEESNTPLVIENGWAGLLTWEP